MAEEDSLESAFTSASAPILLSSVAPQTRSATEYATRSRTRNQTTRQGRRTKLSTEERAKVLEVRRQRACLRCKMLKIQCSKENPCKPCLSSAVRGYERKVLSFCYCVRTKFAEVDIFRSAETGPMPEIPASVRALIDQIEAPTHLPVLSSSQDEEQQQQQQQQQDEQPYVQRHLHETAFEESLLRWLTSPDSAASQTEGDSSIVATLCHLVGSSESLRRAVDDDLTTDFRTFLFATSLAHTGWQGFVAHRDLCVAGHLCGSRIMRRLDRILTPQFLAKCDRETHRALLLLIFGLILGVSYSTRLTISPSFPHDLLVPEMRHSPTLWLTMKEHLAQMLAHHLIFLGSTLGIKLDTASERTIIDTAVNRWHKPERSLWAGFVGDSLPPRLPPTAKTGPLVDFNDLENINPAESDPLHPPSAPPTMVAMSCPDLADLQSMPPFTEDNPDSYLSVTNEEIQGLLSSTPADTNEVATSVDKPKEADDGPQRITKKRSVWIVRPYDDGGSRDPVNVFARLRLQQGQNLGLFV